MGKNIYIGDNLASLNSSAFVIGQINSSANITLRGLTYTTISQIFKDPTYKISTTQVTGSNCLGSTCSQISYNGGVLIFNTTSFSSFKVNGT